jgi:hypothetical protein
MTKTFTAPFAQTPKTAVAVATTASATITGTAPTNTVLLLTAGTDGSILTRLWASPRSTVTAAALYLWLSKDSGTTKYLIDSVLLPAQTVATTTAVAPTPFPTYSETVPLRLAAGDALYIGAGVTETDGVVFHAEYTDF